MNPPEWFIETGSATTHLPFEVVDMEFKPSSELMAEALERARRHWQKRRGVPDVEYDPVYGLPRRSVEEWLARNPRLRKEYEAARRQGEGASGRGQRGSGRRA
jgi:hypothetical protein